MQYKSRSYQKFIAATVSSVVAASVVAPMTPDAKAKENQPHFSDVAEKAYFYQAVSSLSGRGIIKGYDNGLFKPYQQVTRAQAATMIAKSLNLKTDNVKDPGFKDISKNNWAYGSIAALANKGIITGYGNLFKPNEPLTRAQLARMLTLSFKLQASPLKDKRFTDVRPTDWYANDVQALLEKGITSGTTATTFSPNQKVTRGQMATLLYRSELAVKETLVEGVIKGITNQEIATDKGTYTLSPDLKAWINPSNLSVLKGAVLQFNAKSGVVQKVSSVEITASGKSSIDTDNKYTNHLVFDGKNAVINANLVVNGDYISLKNMTVKGNLVLKEAVKSSFYSDNVKVEKKTIVSDRVQVASAQSNNLYKSLSFSTTRSVATASDYSPAASIIFNNSKLGSLEINKQNAMVETTGKTEASFVSINSRVKFSADAATIIPKVTIEAGVEIVEINSNVEDVFIIGNGSITITGNGNFGHMTASIASIVTVISTGKIGLLKTIDKDSKFILGKDTKIIDIQLPAGVEPKTAIPNYENVKNNIQNIGGKENPDYLPGDTVPIPGGGIPQPSNHPPVVDNEITDLTVQANSSGVPVDLSNVFTDADNNTLTLTATSSDPGIATVSVSGNTLTVSPVNVGTSTITVTANDGNGGTIDETFTVTVTQPNRVPVVANEVNDQTAIAGDGPLNVDLSSVFTDEDNDALTLTAASSDSDVATVSMSGNTLTVSPVNAGTSTITVTADDGNGGTKEETFTVTVTQLNRAPVVANEVSNQTAIAGDGPFTVDLSSVFTDADNNTLTLIATSSDLGVATVSVSGNTLTVSPVNVGTSTITVTANDGNGGTIDETFTVTVTQPNRVPVVANEVNDQTAIAGDGPLNVDLSSVFTDEDNDTLTLTATSSDSGVATVSVSGNSLTVSPVTSGTSTITVTANDGKGGTIEETFTVTVTQLNHAPVVANEVSNQTAIAGDGPLNVDLSSVFTDEDNDTLTLTATSSDSGVATVSVSGNSLTVSPVTSGTSTITVTANDGKGGTIDETFTVTVTQLNHAPVVANEVSNQTAIAGDGPVTVDLSNVFTDEDNDDLNLSAVSSVVSTATVGVYGNTLTITPGAAGTSTITVTAADGRGGTVEESFIVTVNNPQLGAAPALFFSETIWGTYDLAFEIYNPTNEEINLSQLKIVLPEKDINFESFGLILKPGEVLAVVDNWFFLENNDIPTNVVTRVPFDIDPALDVEDLEVQLVYGGQVIDTILYKKDKTMLRKSGVTQGASTYSSDEWSENPLDDLDNIGTHTP